MGSSRDQCRGFGMDVFDSLSKKVSCAAGAEAKEVHDVLTRQHIVAKASDASDRDTSFGI
jgi:hypothetical protein